LQTLIKIIFEYCINRHISTLYTGTVEMLLHIYGKFPMAIVTMTTLCLMDVFFNKQSGLLWVLNVFHFTPTCSFIWMRQTIYLHLQSVPISTKDLFVWWCLTPLSTIFQLYRGGQCYWWRKPEDQEKTSDLSHVTTKYTKWTRCCTGEKWFLIQF
jgi:hypothetical protein